MAYTSGTAASYADLKTALESACVANGWTLTSGILSKSGTYFQLTTAGDWLEVRGGTGQTGAVLDGEPLIGPTKSGFRLAGPSGGGGTAVFTFPVDYEIHNFTSPDEVYFVVKYNSDYYQQLSFGKSEVPGIGGTGAWFSSTYSTQSVMASIGGGAAYFTSTSQIGATSQFGGGLFFGAASAYPTSAVNSGLESTGWKLGNGTDLLGPSWAAGILTALPSASNYANVLVPVKAIQPRTSGGRTIIANLKNARFLRIDYINPGDIITFGSEQWKVYPMYRKDAATRDGSNAGTLTHSGTWGYAIKYTGV